MVIDAINERINKGIKYSHINILSCTSFTIMSPHEVFYTKLLTLDKEDNVMSYVCYYSHRSYIVIDPPTFGACPISLLAKKSAQSRDTTCASKNLEPSFMSWESTIPTYGLSKIFQVSCHLCIKQ